MEIAEQRPGPQLVEPDEISTRAFTAPTKNFIAAHIGTTGARSLPPAPKRWVPHIKAEIVAAVQGGYFSLEEACARYALSTEEFLGWQREIRRSGLAGLRRKNTQQRRIAVTSAANKEKSHCAVVRKPRKTGDGGVYV